MAGDPDQYTDGFLGKPNAEYCRWIQDSQKWGGAIELAILSRLDHNVMPEVVGLYNHYLQAHCHVCSNRHLGQRDEDYIVGRGCHLLVYVSDGMYAASWGQAKLGGPAFALCQAQLNLAQM